MMFPAKLFRFTITCLAAATLAIGGAQAAPNPKYASLVIDADTGKVLHAENANAVRYPASLTKLMTLYLAFEALDKGKMTLDTRMKVSQKAARMPQTNISLRQGETITVRDAIKALVVRSANDVAVVMAEHLGKTEWGFGLKMTSKARELGMKNTVFRNASGLPDSKQYSTARDLAVLAMALRSHYPQYYHFFKTTSFTYKGRTYGSHNRAMARIPGADGLKTGFINASGFNLITSIERNNRHLVGVVLGGRTAASRDTHMVELVERSYAKLDTVPTTQFASHTAPVPVAKPGSNTTYERMQLARADSPRPVAKPSAFDVIDNDRDASPASSSHNTGFIAASYTPSATGGGVRSLGTLKGQFQPVSYTTTAPVTSVSGESGWGIQVGAFSAESDAIAAATRATALASQPLARASMNVSSMASNSGGSIYRARLTHLTEDEARNACRALIANNESCFVYQADGAESHL
jgi:D-alanyl-D-alanine carboxypeptidase